MSYRPAEQAAVPPDREWLARELVLRWSDNDVFSEDTNLDHIARDIVAALLRSPADGWRAGAEAMREACATLLPALMPLRQGHNYRDGWIAAVDAYRAAIRALDIPSPPAEETP